MVYTFSQGGCVHNGRCVIQIEIRQAADSFCKIVMMPWLYIQHSTDNVTGKVDLSCIN